jgi:hypothetical protein
VPLHALIETHGALAEVAALAAHPRIESLSFGLMDFVSAHRGAIPQAAMGMAGQFSAPAGAQRQAGDRRRLPPLCQGAFAQRGDRTEGPARLAEAGRPGQPAAGLHAHVEHPPSPDPAHRRSLCTHGS